MSEYREEYEEHESLVGRLADEVLAAKGRGEVLAIDSIVAAHPHCADTIRKALPLLLEWMDRSEPNHVPVESNAELFSESLSSSPGDLIGTSLGDFLILSELGRGGMGIVYEAEQKSLGRRVALKILPWTAFLDERRLLRFQQEAHVAAMLHHPNIVQVYWIGCEKGLQFYVMELVEGRSLDELLKDIREGKKADQECRRKDVRARDSQRHDSATGQDTYPLQFLSTARGTDHETHFRAVARIFVKIAEAIHYAHQQGVIHRDIKPSNLLIGNDGIPWVTDFGLAHLQSETNLTMTGDLVGTLRYMSPEQAQGEKLLDRRTDVYSLGATLYEVLSLLPAIDGADRAQILVRIQTGEFRRLRSVVAEVPRSLELIIEKAMSLHKEDRYATAEMMADDLRRYLDRRPVRARRVGITTRVWHWGQRHRATAALMSTLLVLLFALAVGGPMVAYRYARLAKSQHETIVDLRHLLSESIANTLIELENVPATADAKRKLVDDTLSQSRRLLERGGESDEVRYDVACVYMKLAFVLGLEFGEKLGLKVAGDAISLLEELLQRSPENPAYRFELGRAYRFIGNNSDDSLRQMYFQRSLKLLEPLAAEYKDNLLYGQELDYLRMFFALTHPNDDEADAMMNAALKSTDERRRAASDNVEYLMDHLSVCYYRGKRMSWSDRRDEGLRELQSCYEACQPVLSEILHSTRMHIGYAELNTTLGHLYLESGEIDRAEQYLVQAIQLQDGLIKGYPHSNWLQWSWLQTYCSMAQLQSRQGRTEEAISTYITLLRQKGDFTHLPAWAQGMAVVAEIRLGDLLWLDGRADEANLHYAAALEAELQDDSALLNQALLLADCPNMELRSPEAAIVIIGSRTPFNARWMLALGVAQYRKGEWTGARQSLESGLELRQSDDPDTLAFLASTCANLGDVASARKYAEQSKSSDASPTINWIRHAPARQAAFEREVEETLRTAGDSETQVAQTMSQSN